MNAQGYSTIELHLVNFLRKWLSINYVIYNVSRSIGLKVFGGTYFSYVYFNISEITGTDF